MKDVSSHGSKQSGMDFLTFIANGLFRDLACHEGDWDGVRPWPRPMLASRDVDGADDHPSVKDGGHEKYSSPLMAGILLCARVRKTDHMACKVPNDLGTVAETPRYSVGSKLGCCSLPAIRSTSKTPPPPEPKYLQFLSLPKLSRDIPD